MSFQNKLLTVKGYKSIKENHLFDVGYYLNNSPDIRSSGTDPLLHYICKGCMEGRNPSADFDGNNYTESHPEVNKSELNPLVHYSLYGME